jgi:hypothetical protein
LTKRLRVAINAQVMPNSGAGGIETVLMVLTALTQLDGPEEYLFIGPWERPDWLQPLLGAQQHIIRGPQPSPSRRWNSGPLQRLKPALEPLLPRAHKLKLLLSSPSATKARDGRQRAPHERLKRKVYDIATQLLIKAIGDWHSISSLRRGRRREQQLELVRSRQ